MQTEPKLDVLLTPDQREHLLQWVAELRSGRYEQGTGKLINPDDDDHDGITTHCCLGVACEILRRSSTIPKELQTLAFDTLDPNDSDVSELPQEINEYFGLTNEFKSVNPLGSPYESCSDLASKIVRNAPFDSGVVLSNHLVTDLFAGLNDRHHFTFDQIADYIVKVLAEDHLRRVVTESERAVPPSNEK